MNIISSGCSAPSGDPEDALPDGGNGYESTADEPYRRDVEGVEAFLIRNYDGPSGALYSFAVVEYPSSDNVEEKTEDIIENSEPSEDVDADAEPIVGYITVEKYAYLGAGSSEDSIEELMQMSEPLGQSCVENNIKYP